MKYDLVEKEIFDYYLQVDPGNPGAKTALYKEKSKTFKDFLKLLWI